MRRIPPYNDHFLPFLKTQYPTDKVDLDRIAFAEVAAEDLERQRVLDLALDDAF